jgi:hypothetical protein
MEGTTLKALWEWLAPMARHLAAMETWQFVELFY